ncbi:MAG: N-glycosylase/DNA lyase [Candidatus Omnitrophica bacterium]|nr:N-glycosylase/DNA lyase [Candidatus Omnitrophota bacterium]
MPTIKGLLAEYRKKKRKIKKRLREFRIFQRKKDRDIFKELCFCILTPQSKAVCCNEAVEALAGSNLLYRGSILAIRRKLKGLARFHNKKAAYIVEARNIFEDKQSKKLDIKSKINPEDILGTREWLVRNIKGLGYKEASHFLRNIGMGRDISILDVHILRNLKEFGVIKDIPDSLAKKDYILIEGRMRDFAVKVGIPLEELDLLFWSRKTGFVFK